jgi:hypothetical protein
MPHPGSDRIMTLTSDIPPEVYPLAPFVGRWRGTGTVGYPGIEESGIVQDLVIASDGGPYLTYSATTWLAGADGHPGERWHTESGYWRVVPGQTDPQGKPRLDPPFEVELLLADPAGYAAIYYGQVSGARITVASDVLARTADAAEMTAGRRLYGLVDGDLLWAWDIAAFGHELQSYMALRLAPVTGEGPPAPPGG